MSRNIENRMESGRNDAKEQPKKGVFAKERGLLSTLKEGAKRVAVAATVALSISFAGCEPEVTINNIPYNPFGTDSGAECSALTEECQESITVKLREADSTAGSNTADVENAVLTLVEVSDEDNTKAAKLDLEACEDIAEGTFTSGEEITLTVADASFETKVDSVEYDGEGVLVTVTLRPSCPEVDDAGTSEGTEMADGEVGPVDAGKQQAD